MSSLCGKIAPKTKKPALTLQPIVTKGLSALTDIAFATGYPDLLFVIEQNKGTIRTIRKGILEKKPFLDMSSLISKGGERGMLGLAFHPRFQKNQRFFVYYTDRQGDVQIAEFRSDPKVMQGLLSTHTPILSIPQPEGNHNGGALRFGKEGFLYIGVGDGGGANDEHGKAGNGQNPKTWLGKILRIDVDRKEKGKNYAIPPSNPFHKQATFLPEIYHWGLRNPWRISIDRTTGDLWVGDVGQNEVEEINFSAANQGGLNFGWRCKEGLNTFRKDPLCAQTPLQDPVIHLPQQSVPGVRYCSMMAGILYRGSKMPQYHGTFFYGDWCAPHLRSFQWCKQKAYQDAILPNVSIHQLTSWGEDYQGELYLTTLGGKVYKLVPKTPL